MIKPLLYIALSGAGIFAILLTVSLVIYIKDELKDRKERSEAVADKLQPGLDLTITEPVLLDEERIELYKKNFNKNSKTFRNAKAIYEEELRFLEYLKKWGLK